MSHRALRWPLSHIAPAGRDLAVALAVTALAEVEVWVADIPGPRGVSAMAPLLYGLALVWRRRAPLGVAVIVAATMNAEIVTGVPKDAPSVDLLALVIAMYSLGSWATVRGMILGGGFTLASSWLVFVTDPPFDPTDIPFSAILTLTPLMLGRALSTTQREADEAAQRAEQERERAAAEAIADERARIARELHDVVSHSISVMGVQAGAVRKLMPAGHDELEQTLRSVEETGREALGEMQRLLGIVRVGEPQATHAPQPGLARLDELVDQARDAGLSVDLHWDAARAPLPHGFDLAAFRIVQEALTNVRRHARGAHAEVVVRQGEDELEIVVTDDGPGLSAQHRPGHGIIGMRERASLYGGELEIGPAPGGGCRLRARLPLNEAR